MASRNSYSIVAIGFMLFALFFGAGNLIFPVKLGQMAGENLFSANAGFIITGVGLPVLGILTLAYSGKGDIQAIASRVHPLYGLIFTMVLYLTIGPFFAIPRTNTVSFEIGIKPFLGDYDSFLPLFIFTVLFFGVTLYFSLQSSKLVDVIGKVLTPLLLIFIGVLIITAIFNPMGQIQAPTESYMNNSFFKGFQEGYLTMDAIAAFVFGIIIIDILKDSGATTRKVIMLSSVKVALIAGVLLAIIYTSLAYLGSISVEVLGHLDNGGAILASASQYYFGSYGKVLLALIVIAACLTTSIGLITSCAAYFNKLYPTISYRRWAIIFTIFSGAVSNFGLSRLIEISVPVLSLLYPLAICLIALTFLHPFFKGKKEVYQVSILFTFIVSMIDNLEAIGFIVSMIDKLKVIGITMQGIEDLFTAFIPWYSLGLGWVVPAIVGGIIGYILSLFRKEDPESLLVERKGA